MNRYMQAVARHISIGVYADDEKSSLSDSINAAQNRNNDWGWNIDIGCVRHYNVHLTDDELDEVIAWAEAHWSEVQI